MSYECEKCGEYIGNIDDCYYNENYDEILCENCWLNDFEEKE